MPLRDALGETHHLGVPLREVIYRAPFPRLCERNR